jgi:hypothetical protein
MPNAHGDLAGVRERMSALVNTHIVELIFLVPQEV